MTFSVVKISPDPSLLKRGTRLVPDIFIVPLWKREVLSSPRWKRGAYFPLFFYHTIHYRARKALTSTRILD